MYNELVCIDGVPPSIRHTTVPDHTDSLAHKPSKTTAPLIDPVVSALAVCGDRVTRPKHMAKVSKTEPPVRAISAAPEFPEVEFDGSAGRLELVSCSVVKFFGGDRSEVIDGLV